MCVVLFLFVFGSVPVADSSGEAVAEDTPSSKFAVLADWEDPDDPSTLHTLHMRGEAPHTHTHTDKKINEKKIFE